MPHPSLPPGIYQHFKGGLYEVIGVARLTDTSDWFVVYRPLAKHSELVLRPFEEFTETVFRDGREQARFHLIQERVGDGPVAAKQPG